MNIKDQLRKIIWIKVILKTRWWWLLKSLLFNSVIVGPEIDDSTDLKSAEQVNFTWPQTSSKPYIGLVKDHSAYPYWTKYQRFLKNNHFPFQYYNIHSEDWLKRAEKLDVIIWRPHSSVSSLDEARRKIYVLEKRCGKKCFPSYDTLLLYEDKMMQYFLLSLKNFPVIPTFISNDYEETLRKLMKMRYPIISKLTTGSGSAGVEMIKNPNLARKIVDKIFSPNGRITYWRYARQKDYVYFQDYLENDGYDLRVIVIGNCVFGYYRKAPKGDYRASGMGIYEKRAIPLEAMQLARKVCDVLGEGCLAVDMLRDKNGNYYIIETSVFIQVNTPEQLHVDGISGMYLFKSETEYDFVPGKFWIQEIALRNFFLTKFCSGSSL